MRLKKKIFLRLLFLCIFSFSLPQQNCFSKQASHSRRPDDEVPLRLFKTGQKDQKALKWQQSVNRFRQVIKSYPRTRFAQKAHIEIGKYYKYNRDWQKAIEEYHQAIDISADSRDAHDARTAEAAVYYFRQDFNSALDIFQDVLSKTNDWDQIKYCSYWIKEIKRKSDIPQEESFSCGPRALRIALNLLGIKAENKEIAALFKSEEKQASLYELTKVASQKGLKPKVVKIAKNEILNLSAPFIALVNPEHYVVVTDTGANKVNFIDPAAENSGQAKSLDDFSRDFKGYALIFMEEKKFAKADLVVPPDEELQKVKAGVCWCCPPSSLGGSGTNPNVEFDGSGACSVGMPSWMVNTANLNFIVQDMDLSYSSRGMPVEFVRTYNSDDPREGVFGRSWTFNYNIVLTENPDKSIDIRRGDGRVDHFFWNGTRYQGPGTVFDILTKNADSSYSLKIKKDKTTQNFNSHGQLVNIKDRNNNTITFTYDSDGNLVTITDPSAKNITLDYNADKKVSRINLPDGRHADFTYDADDNLVEAGDTKQAASGFTYDSASYITSISTPHRGTTEITYSTSGEGRAVESITDALGNKRRYGTYQNHYQVRVIDSRGNATLYKNNHDSYTQAIITASGNRIDFEYDSSGNRVKIANQGNIAALAYDGRGNVISITDPLDKKTSFSYDSNDNLVQSTDPGGKIYNFSYDSNSNLLEARDPDNKATSFTYNSYGQLSRITDAVSGAREFTYDASGNLIKTTDPLGKIVSYGYDSVGRLTSLTDPKGQAFSYEYDGVDHLTKVIYSDASTLSYTYNCCNLIEAEDKNGKLQFSYDALGRMTGFINQNNNSLSYEYDEEGNLVSLIYPGNKKVSYKYDKDNRLVKVTDWLGKVTEYNYDAKGNLAFSISPGLLTVHQYDALGRLTKLVNYNSNTLTITSGFEFSLDDSGNRSSIERYMPLNLPSFNLPSSSYAYNSANQVLSATGKGFEYDDNGNLIRQLSGALTANLSYDSDNRLTGYNQDTINLAFQYDPLGNRIQKTNGPATTSYIIDPNRSLPSVLAETDSSGNITAYYVYGLGLISKIEGANAYYYQYDGLGSTVAITDSSGKLKNKYAYDDFGNLATNSAETISNPFKYVGRYGVMTDLPDLLYMRARYYMPSIGRFINEDPIGLAGGMNLYNYVGGNPIGLIDPMGLSWKDLDPNYGNWGGNNWSGGKYVCNGGIGNMSVPGIDSMDDLFKQHDYESYMSNSQADNNLARALRLLPKDPRRWKRSPLDVNRARRYRWLAELWFR